MRTKFSRFKKLGLGFDVLIEGYGHKASKTSVGETNGTVISVHIIFVGSTGYARFNP